MGKLDGLKKALSKTAEKAKEAGSKLKEVDFKQLADKTQETIRSTAENLQDSIKNFDADTAKQNIAEMAKKGTGAVKQYLKNAKETDERVKKALKESERSNDTVLAEDALKMIYLLMMADSKISHEEKERFASIVPELDVERDCDAQSIADTCNALIVSSNRDEYMDFIMDGIQDALHHSKESGKGTIGKKLLLWNLLAVAYSDGEYSENEKKVLRTVNRRMEIDPSIILEMEAAV